MKVKRKTTNFCSELHLITEYLQQSGLGELQQLTKSPSTWQAPCLMLTFSFPPNSPPEFTPPLLLLYSPPLLSSSPPWLPLRQAPVHHDPLNGRLFPFRSGVEYDGGLAAVDSDSLPDLSDQGFPEGLLYPEAEGEDVTLPLGVVLGEVVGEGVSLVSPLDALVVLPGAGVAAVPRLARVDRRVLRPLLRRAHQARAGV